LGKLRPFSILEQLRAKFRKPDAHKKLIFTAIRFVGSYRFNEGESQLGRLWQLLEESKDELALVQREYLFAPSKYQQLKDLILPTVEFWE
jgi:hypothetical protein